MVQPLGTGVFPNMKNDAQTTLTLIRDRMGQIWRWEALWQRSNGRVGLWYPQIPLPVSGLLIAVE